jgi:hypothetical protein
MTTDAYGVPDLLLGPIPEEFYAAVGRVVSLSVLVEMKVGELVSNLDRENSSDKHAGQRVGSLIDLAKEKLALTPSHTESGRALLERTRAALEQRHAVAHSLWPNATVESAAGWRPVVALKRVDGQAILWTKMDGPGFRALIAELVDLVDELDQLKQKASHELSMLLASRIGETPSAPQTDT